MHDYGNDHGHLKWNQNVNSVCRRMGWSSTYAHMLSLIRDDLTLLSWLICKSVGVPPALSGSPKGNNPIGWYFWISPWLFFSPLLFPFLWPYTRSIYSLNRQIGSWVVLRIRLWWETADFDDSHRIKHDLVGSCWCQSDLVDLVCLLPNLGF